MKLARGAKRSEAGWRAAAGVGETMPPLHPLIQHPLRTQPSLPQGRRGAEKRKEELGGLAIPKGSHTVHTRQKPKKQQSVLFQWQTRRRQKGPWCLQREKRRGKGARARYDNIHTTPIGPTLSPSSHEETEGIVYSRCLSVVPHGELCPATQCFQKKKSQNSIDNGIQLYTERTFSDSCNIDETRNHYTK